MRNVGGQVHRAHEVMRRTPRPLRHYIGPWGILYVFLSCVYLLAAGAVLVLVFLLVTDVTLWRLALIRCKSLVPAIIMCDDKCLLSFLTAMCIPLYTGYRYAFDQESS
jgi:hypothetical protein